MFTSDWEDQLGERRMASTIGRMSSSLSSAKKGPFGSKRDRYI